MFELYRRLLGYIPERSIHAWVSIALAAISCAMNMVAYWLLYQTLVLLLVGNDSGQAASYAMWIVLAMVAYGLLNIVALLHSHYLGFGLETKLRTSGLNDVLDASFSFFDTHQSGEVRRIIDDNAGNTHRTVAHLIPNNVSAIVTPVLMFVLLGIIDWRLCALLLVTIAIGALQYKAMYGRPELMEKFGRAMEEMSSASVEYVRGIQVIKIFGVTVHYYKALIDAIREYRDNIYQYTLSCRRPYVGFQVLFNVFYALVIPFAILFIVQGEPVGVILVKALFFSMFSGVCYSAFMAVMFTGMDNYQAKQALNHLENLRSEMAASRITSGDLDEMQRFDVEFRDVTYAYGDRVVLDGFSCTLKAGKTYALVGPSGGGKSTIAKLISGFYPVSTGELLIGGNSIHAYTEDALLCNIAYVFQNAKLFPHMSIYENVHCGRPAASRDEVMRALEDAECLSILDKFSDREATVVGSEGVHLSGGEVQRIAVARAMLKNANILILDEASAAADPENEYELQRAFTRLMEGKTVIMIAHRLSAIRNVDEILFIEDGQVVERGSEQELMQASGRYRQLTDLYQQANDWRVS
ncbi:ABC transporter ATP-binding protein [Olsenella sp. Marseille-P4559]|jgi:ATP-binding cassette subfamily B protein|uniref:ABC transporter ATP-binding protein n=1 Tax=Olsenella sp. Marseille-P4559 TaxID=2364795 RepID=UPI00102FD82D|nr:ABC transporter ATP-binding protein [Olsenella sp. Marseille-P4559]MCH3955780.1 ABC transporter ATP-binding protein/permease [Olsenella sp.]MCI2156635.1 ABC transporter ATP-binding protein/permease [Olsenella sp.]MCI2160093.1 ABC transporter ATP-binding protein/permease [Olsenella sp.]